jgi:uncharacterized protein (UPF0261 family)
MKTIYVVGTCDTKQEELGYVKRQVVSTGVPALLVDVGTRGRGLDVDVSAETVAGYHPRGASAVLSLGDRGEAVDAMGLALAGFLMSRPDVGGVIGVGGGGNTSLVTRAMRALPVGVPKLMVSTVASGNTAPYVGFSDICMISPVTDVAGLNSLNRVILGNAAHAIAGMVARPTDAFISSELTAIGITQFGVTTPCVDRLRARLSEDFECMVFHATGVGGQVMEKLLESRLLHGLIDVTTTEIADYLVGGVLPCTEDRFGSVIRTQAPCVVSCGALDMVNFGAAQTIPTQFRGRLLYKHNPEVTLMRTTREENALIGEWMAQRLNLCNGPVRVVVPEGGVSALDAPGQPFHDPAADQALFDALERHLRRSAMRTLVFAPFHINDSGFTNVLCDNFRQVLPAKRAPGDLQ